MFAAGNGKIMSTWKPGNLLLFTLIALLIIGTLAYLGFRTLEHEALLRHYQSQLVAQTRTAQAADFIMNLLAQKATRLDAMAHFLEPDGSALGQLEERDEDIDAVFVLDRGSLSYPNQQGPLSKREQDWLKTVMPLAHDPSLLYSFNAKDEGELPRSGWYIVNEAHEPVLIYWIRKEAYTIGFRISYIKLLADVINAADFDFAPALLLLKENSRLLYQSRSDSIASGEALQSAIYLPYPLSAWRVEYYARETGTAQLYLWGGLFLLLVLSAFTLIMFRLYREYTRTARLAQQQVGFVSQVSHELKTPLTNITLYAELLKEELEDTHGEGARYAGVIASESQRLSRLIQNILSFTRTPEIRIQALDVSQLIRRIADVFGPSFQAKGIALTVDAPGQVMIDSDVDRLTQIVSNFLNNAEKYAAAGRRVELAVEERSDAVDIRVRDYGPGIAEKEVRKIFQPFYRIGSALTEGVSGTGIGLTIARQLAETLHGEILVSHPRPGVCFTLRLKRIFQDAG